MSIFELYAVAELTKEVRQSINDSVRKILAIQYPDGCFTTDEHEEILRQECAAHSVIL